MAVQDDFGNARLGAQIADLGLDIQRHPLPRAGIGPLNAAQRYEAVRGHGAANSRSLARAVFVDDGDVRRSAIRAPRDSGQAAQHDQLRPRLRLRAAA
jgi:hypothetical protein